MNLSIRITIISVLCFFFFLSLANAADSKRLVVDLDSGWKFIKQDVSAAEQVATDDSKWDAVNLPHTWNNVDGEDGGNNYYRGVGWYRLHLRAEPVWAAREIYLKFDAASMVTTVYVNGKPAGTHAGGFSAFCFDITPLLNLRGDNFIAVKVSNKKELDVPPLAGDFTMFGGLYRSVHLIVTNRLCVSPVDDASSGVYIRQDHVDSDSAVVTVATVLLNPKSENASIHITLLNAKGVLVAETIQKNLTTPHAAVNTTITIPQPHLWNGRKDPYLYMMRVDVQSGETIVDEVEQPVGLRFFKIDHDLGFFLNGQPLRLLGVNRHQDHLDKGWAISLADHQADFANMMEMGCTGVRLAHYQHAQEFYDLCDHGGIVAWAEVPIINMVNTTREFDQNASQQLRELIKQSYNHPAICFWSLSNELGNAGPTGVSREEEKQHQVDLITQLNEQAKNLDPTRLTTQASDSKPGMAKDAITDVISFNRYQGWYGGKPDELAANLDNFRLSYPNRGVALSEYGAGAAVTQHETSCKQPKANGKWHPEEWQCIVHEKAWSALKPRSWIWGTFIWCEHDFASDGRNEGDGPGRNDKGLVTYDGKIKKDAFYFYKANWSTDPMIYITERRLSPRPMSDAPVKVYSNCDAVELNLNGKSLGTASGSDINVFIWDNVHLQPGDNSLQATGTRGRKTYTDRCNIVFDVNAIDGHPPSTKPTAR